MNLPLTALLVSTRFPTHTTPLGVFITVTGKSFAIHRPPVTEAEEQQLIEALREIVEDKGID